MGKGVVGVLPLTVIVTRSSPYDGTGSPDYDGFNTSLEFFRSSLFIEGEKKIPDTKGTGMGYPVTLSPSISVPI